MRTDRHNRLVVEHSGLAGFTRTRETASAFATQAEQPIQRGSRGPGEIIVPLPRFLGVVYRCRRRRRSRGDSEVSIDHDIGEA